jgi:hypothetical protein
LWSAVLACSVGGCSGAFSGRPPTAAGILSAIKEPEQPPRPSAAADAISANAMQRLPTKRLLTKRLLLGRHGRAEDIIDRPDQFPRRRQIRLRFKRLTGVMVIHQ